MKRRTKTKALSWLLCLAMLMSLFPSLSLTAFAAGTSVWTGEEQISWNTIEAPGSQYETPGDIFSGLQAGDTISVSAKLTDDCNNPQYVLTYKSGDNWDWTDLNINVSDGGTIITYTVESDQIASYIAERGLIFRGLGYTITNITVTKAHTHDFTYSADGATITATCSAEGCELEDSKATLTLKAPENLIADGKAKAATVEGEIPGVDTPAVVYTKDGSAVNAEDVKEEGSYTVSITLEGVTASIDFEITAPYYTITIPAKLDAANPGWNESDGISASGAIGEGKKLTVTAASANNWTLKSGDNAITYYLAAAEDGEKTTAWDFTNEELAAENGTTKPMGAVFEEYVNMPAGNYTDTVTFTASVVKPKSITIEEFTIYFASGDAWKDVELPSSWWTEWNRYWKLNAWEDETILAIGGQDVTPNDEIIQNGNYYFYVPEGE